MHFLNYLDENNKSSDLRNQTVFLLNLLLFKLTNFFYLVATALYFRAITQSKMYL